MSSICNEIVNFGAIAVKGNMNVLKSTVNTLAEKILFGQLLSIRDHPIEQPFFIRIIQSRKKQGRGGGLTPFENDSIISHLHKLIY